MDIKKVNKILQNHEERISALEKKKGTIGRSSEKNWYRQGSTVEKVILLIKEGFFNRPKSIKDIVDRLIEKDFHLQASDLTLPLRKIVRKGLLRRTKQLPIGVTAKKWYYVKT